MPKRPFTPEVSTETPVQSYNNFWQWFADNADDFFKVIKAKGNIENGFINKIAPRLNQLREGFFFLAGMSDTNTAELIITADGNAKNIVFVEELVQAAPPVNGWKFTALKPGYSVDNVDLQMNGIRFYQHNLSFYATEYPVYPDLIHITIVHNNFSEQNRETITNGTYLFLDGYLGELDFLYYIDDLNITGRDQAMKEPIPISKLKDYLIWRQKEFVEKYEATSYSTANDNYSLLEADLENGNKLIAVINTSILHWDAKASHPWVASITLKYDGSGSNDLPDKEDYTLLNQIEDEITEELTDMEGFLNIGRQTAGNERKIWFTCKDFRKPAKVFSEIERKYSGRFKINSMIYKDKYWLTFDRFIAH